MTDTALLRDGFETRAIRMQPMWLIMFQAPAEDVDRIFEAVTRIVPLKQGRTDRNGYRAPAGIEPSSAIGTVETNLESEKSFSKYLIEACTPRPSVPVANRTL